MKSLAIKSDYPEIATSAAGPAKDYFPSLTVTDKQIPELADMAIGDECTICIKVRVTGMNVDNRGTRINLDCLSGEYEEQESESES